MPQARDIGWSFWWRSPDLSFVWQRRVSPRSGDMQRTLRKGLCNKPCRAAAPRGVHIPYFDPLNGGRETEALFLLEAPGPRVPTSSPGHVFLAVFPRIPMS